MANLRVEGLSCVSFNVMVCGLGLRVEIASFNLNVMVSGLRVEGLSYKF